MSAYICNPEHFGILAAYASQKQCVIREWDRLTHSDNSILEAQRVARCLALENIRSVAYRYPDDKDGHRPGPCLKDAEILEAAAIYAAYFVEHLQSVTPVQILRLIDCLDYQSCETDDWQQTLAFKQLGWIRGRAIYALPGYDRAQWSFDHPIPEIEALYAGGEA